MVPAGVIVSRRHLVDLRVIQKNLVYVIGISARIAHENILSETEYFGQFGRILKIVVNRRNTGAPLPADKIGSSGGATTTSGSAYVTYSRAEEAARAISYVDGSVFDGRVLRATYGTTKYCSYFLRGIACPNPGCMYLHEEGETADSFTKEALSSGKMQLHSSLVGESEGAAMRQFGTILYRPPPPRVLSPAPPLHASISSSPCPPSLGAGREPTGAFDIVRPSSATSLDELTKAPKINLEQCEDETLSFLSRLSRWNKSTDFDEDLAKSAQPCSPCHEQITAFDPFSETLATPSLAIIERDTLAPSMGTAPPHRIGAAGDGFAVPTIAKGTLPGFDWSASRASATPPTASMVLFKKAPRPAPVGSPLPSMGLLSSAALAPVPAPMSAATCTVASPSRSQHHPVTTSRETLSSDHQRHWIDSLLEGNKSSPPASSPPPPPPQASLSTQPTNAQKQWTSLFFLGTSGNPSASASGNVHEGRRAVDATQLEQQFFRETQPPLIPMAASTAACIANTSNHNDSPGKAPETSSPKMKGMATTATTTTTATTIKPTAVPPAPPMSPDGGMAGRKKVAPPPPIALARIKEAAAAAAASTNASPAASPALATATKAAAKTAKLSVGRASTTLVSSSPSLPPSHSHSPSPSPVPSISRSNLFAVLDDQPGSITSGVANNSSESERECLPPTNPPEPTEDSPSTTTATDPRGGKRRNQSSTVATSNGIRKESTAPVPPATPSVSPIAAAIPPRRPPPTLPSQPHYAIPHWPSPANHYQSVVGPVLAQMAEQERSAWRKWLESEDRVNRTEETTLRAKLVKLHGEMTSWMSSLAVPASVQ